jgi:hypothetical protein
MKFRETIQAAAIVSSALAAGAWAASEQDDAEYRRLMREVETRVEGQSLDSNVEAAAARRPLADDSAASGRADTDSSDADTVLVLSSATVDDILDGLDQRRRSSRERGYGGGLGPIPGLYGISMQPVEELIQSAPKLGRYGFDNHGRYEMMLLMGGMGYGGVGNGVRIGGGGRGGSISFSEKGDDDTLRVLEVGVGFGGFLVEKAIVAGRMNLLLGGMAGAGNISVTPRTMQVTEFPFERRGDDAQPQTKARFMLLEVHGGFTYSVLSWLHIGVDLSGPFFISTSGFRVESSDFGLTDGFTTFNPGGRLRLILGNLG